MWIMIIREIPVDEEFRPERFSLHWAEPWEKLSDKELLHEIFHNEHMMELAIEYIREKHIDEYERALKIYCDGCHEDNPYDLHEIIYGSDLVASVDDSITKHIKPIRRILEGVGRFREKREIKGKEGK